MIDLKRKDLFRQEYNKLTSPERERLLQSIAERDVRFQLLRFECFERFGMKTESAVYKCGDAEFVFVPGDTVTLGLEKFAYGINEETRAEVQEGLDDFGIEISDIDKYLLENMSPVRQNTLSPMLVEREFKSIGWRRSDLNSLEMAPFKDVLLKNIEKYNFFELHKSARIRKENGETVAEIYCPVSLEKFVKNIAGSGFSIPTEDEWEYLCGGGSRTLFRWGDSFDFNMTLLYVHKLDSKRKSYTLKEPNQFGLSIAYDPYIWEVVDSECFLKGGDGGSNMCGLGMTLGYLPVATYYRPECMSEDKNDIGCNFYRRIVRL